MNSIEESCTEHSWSCLYCCGLNDAFQFSLSGLASLSTLLPLVPGNEFAVCDSGMLLVGREFFLFCDSACVGGGSHGLVCDSFCDLGQTLPASGSQAPFQEVGRAGFCISIWHQVHCVFSLYLPLSKKEYVWTQNVPLPLAVSLILMLSLSCISFPSSFSFFRFWTVAWIIYFLHPPLGNKTKSSLMEFHGSNWWQTHFGELEKSHDGHSWDKLLGLCVAGLVEPLR